MEKMLGQPLAFKPKPYLMRYMDFSKFISLLLYSKLFFPVAALLPDRAEGLKYSKQKIVLIKALQYIIESKQEICTPSVSAEKTPIAEEVMNERQELIKNFILVSSWTEAEHESYGMWKSYVGETNGVIIRSSIDKIKKAIDPNSEVPLDKFFDYVSYKDQEKHEEENYIKPFFYKKREYSYESEYRVIVDGYKLWDEKKNESRELYKEIFLNKGVYVPVNIKELIIDVIVSPFSNPLFKELVEKVIEDKGLKREMPVRESTLLDSVQTS